MEWEESTLNPDDEQHPIPEGLEVIDPTQPAPPAAPAGIETYDAPVATPAELSQAVMKYALSAEDLWAEEAKLKTVSLLSRMTDYSPEYIMENYVTLMKEWTGGEISPQAWYTAVKNSWDTGWLNYERGKLGYELAFEGGGIDTLAQLEELEQRMPEIDTLKRDLPVAALKAAAEMLPFWIRGGIEAGQGATGRSHTNERAQEQALDSLQKIDPELAAKYEEEEFLYMAPSFGSFYSLGMAASGAEAIGKVEAGLAYLDMVESGINERHARLAAAPVGIINGAIEVLQVSKLPGIKQLLSKAAREATTEVVTKGILHTAARGLMEYGKTIATETAQETLQELTNILFERIATNAHNRVEKDEKKQVDPATLDATLARLSETIKQSVLAFSVMGMPGTVVHSAKDLQRAKNTGDQISQDVEAGVRPSQAILKHTTEDPTAEPQTKSEKIAEFIATGEEAAVDEVIEQLADEEEAAQSAEPWMQTSEEYTAAQDEISRELDAEIEAAAEEELLGKNEASLEIDEELIASGKDAAGPEKTRARFQEQLEKAFPAYTPQEVAGAIEFAQIRADAMQMPLKEYLDTYMDQEIVTRDPGTLTMTGKKGAVEFLEMGRAIIRTGDAADFGTWVHENGHIFRRQLTDDQEAVLREWTGFEGEWGTEAARDAEEMFSNGLIQYAREGVYPNERVKTLFDQFIDFLNRVYAFLDERVVLNDAMRQVYHELLGGTTGPTPAPTVKQNAIIEKEIPLFQYIGEKATLSAIQSENLSVAKKMEKDGMAPDTIRLATGWFRGPYDQLWRYEIMENKAILLNDYEEISESIGELRTQIRYPELYDAYPELAWIPTKLVIDPDADQLMKGYTALNRRIGKGNRNRYYINLTAKNPEILRSALFHEIQHVIQDIEGYARGGSDTEFINRSAYEQDRRVIETEIREFIGRQPEDARHYMHERLQIGAMRDAILLSYNDEEIAQDLRLKEQLTNLDHAQLTSQSPFYKEHPGMAKAFTRLVIKRDRLFNLERRLTPQDQYLRLAGELEARDIQSRFWLSAEERKGIAPFSSSSFILQDEVIVRYDDPIAALIADNLDQSLESELVREAEGYETLDAFRDAIRDRALFHGTAEPIEGKLRAGGYDDMFWTATSPDVAQNYIPESGSMQFYSFDQYALNDVLPPHKDFHPLLKQMGYDLADFNIEYNQNGRAISYRTEDRNGRRLPDSAGAEAFLESLGYQKNHYGQYQAKTNASGTIFRADYQMPGTLFIAFGREKLSILDISTGETDLMDLQYHKLNLFREAEKQGYDGVKIDDFAHHGELGHRSIGIFQGSIEKLRIVSIPAKAFAWDGWEDVQRASTPEFDQWIKDLYAESHALDTEPNILYQPDEDAVSLITDEELKEIGVAYGSKEEYRRSLSEALSGLRQLATREKRRRTLPHGRGRLREGSSEVAIDDIKRINLVGKTVTGPRELAELFSLFRNPRVEIFQILYTSETGEILGHTAITAGIPSSVQAALGQTRTEGHERVRETMKRLGASKVYIAHNHPSGDPRASDADFSVTIGYRESLGDSFGGHIIIDHELYNILTGTDDFDFIEPFIQPKRSYQSTNVQNEFTISSSDDAALRVKELFEKPKTTVMLALNNKHKIVAWSYIEPQNAVSFQPAMKALRAFGGSKAILITNDDAVYTATKEWQDRVQEKFLPHDPYLDIIRVATKTGAYITSAVEEGLHIGGRWQDIKRYYDKEAGRPGYRYVVNNEADQRVLFQEEEESDHERQVREAVEQGLPVPERVLQEYADREWAAAELESRQEGRELPYGFEWLYDEAKNFSSSTEFTDYLRAVIDFDNVQSLKEKLEDPTAFQRWVERIWNQANQELLNRDEANRRFIDEIENPESLRALIDTITVPDAAGMSVSPILWGISRRKGSGLSDRQYAAAFKIVSQNPTKYRTIEAAILQDEDMIRQLQYEETMEGLDITKAREEAEAQAAENLRNEALRLLEGTKDEVIERLISGELKLQEAMDAAEQAEKESAQLKRTIKKYEREIATDNQRLRRAEEVWREEHGKNKAAERTIARLQQKIEKTEQARKKEAARIHNIYAREKARKRAREAKLHIAKLIMNPVPKTVAFEYRQKIEAIQDTIDPHFRRKGTIELLIREQRFLDDHDVLFDDPRTRNRELVESIVSPKVRNIIFKKSLNNWTYDDLLEVWHEVELLIIEGRMEQELKISAEWAEVKGYARSMEWRLHQGKPAITAKTIGSDLDRKQDRSKFWGAVFATLRPNRILNMFDNTDERGPFHEYFGQKINALTDEELRNIQKRQERIKAKMQELGINPQTLSRRIWLNNQSFSADAVMDMYAGVKNDLKRAAILNGNHLTMGDITLLTSQLSENERILADEIIKEYDENYERIRQAFIDYANEDMGHELFYTPIIRTELDGLQFKDQMAQELLARQHLRSAYAEKGFTKSRIHIKKEHHPPVRLGLVSTWMGQVARQEHFAVTSKHIRQMQRVLKEVNFKTAMRNKYTTQGLKWLQAYIDGFADPNIYRDLTPGSKISRMLRNNMALAYLSFNMVTVLKQAPSIAYYLGYAGPQHIIGAALEGMQSPHKLKEFVESRDPQVANRSIDRIMEEIQQTDKTGYDLIIAKIGKIGMVPIAMMDKTMVCIGWKACYDRATAKGMSEEEAIRYAQDATLKTQPAARAKDLAQVYRSNEGLNWLLMFSNQLNQLFNIAVYDIPTAARKAFSNKTPKGIKTTQKEILAGQIAGYVIGSLVMGTVNRRGRPPEKPDEGILDVWHQFLSSVPILGRDIMNAAKGWDTGVKPFEFVTGTVESVVTFSKLLKGERLKQKQIERAIKRFLESLAVGGGIPYISPKRFIEGIRHKELKRKPWKILQYIFLGGEPRGD